MPRLLRDVSARPHDLLRALAAALDGTGPAVRPVDPVPDDDPGPSSTTQPQDDPGPSSPTVPDEVMLVVATSGSTGQPRDVLLSGAALRASAAATAARLGGAGQWLLTLPAHHVAGVQVLVRSLLAGTPPAVLPPGPFRAAGFVAAASSMTGERRHVSLVPTQLVRLLGDEAGTAALRGFDAVLVGGAGVPPALRARAREAGVRLVVTYGMTETCGGCVYDGLPLDGVGVRLDDDGRVLLSGPVLATGYRDRPDLDAAGFRMLDGVRHHVTADLGLLVSAPVAELGHVVAAPTSDLGPLAAAHTGHPGPVTATPTGTATPATAVRVLRANDPPGVLLRVLGRADDVVVTGGEKVAPAAVEAVLTGVDGIGEVVVVGVDDDRWGSAVVALVVPRAGGPPDLPTVRSAAASALGRAAAPRHLLVVDSLPLRGPGKVDRRAAARLAASLLGRPSSSPDATGPGPGPAFSSPTRPPGGSDGHDR